MLGLLASSGRPRIRRPLAPASSGNRSRAGAGPNRSRILAERSGHLNRPVARKRTTVGLLFAASVVALLAQQHPSFSGRWGLAGVEGQPSQPLIIRQTTTSLEVENWSRSGPSSGIYEWEDAAVSGHTIKATWRGATLVTVVPEVTGDFGAGATRTESWSLDPTGTLTVEIAISRPQLPPKIDRFLYRRIDAPR